MQFLEDKMADWDLLLTDARIATMREGAEDYGTINGGAVAIADGKIAWLGQTADLPDVKPAATRSVEYRWLTPALIDCHTHLVFGGDRAAEFEQRLAKDEKIWTDTSRAFQLY